MKLIHHLRLIALLTLVTACSGSTVRADVPSHSPTPADPRPSFAAQLHARPGLLPGAPSIPLHLTTVRVPILMYHHVAIANPKDHLQWDLSVSPADFAAQMSWLDGHGYNPIDFKDLRAYFDNRAPLPVNPIILSFDDGYSDFYTNALPVLEQHRFKAVAYIVSGFVLDRQRGYMTPTQLLDVADYGVEIASHTVSHPNLNLLSAEKLVRQLTLSKRDLEHLLDQPVLDFCYPGGDFNANVVAAVQRAGYLTATTTSYGAEHSWQDRYTWTRVRVHGGERLAAFTATLQQP